MSRAIRWGAVAALVLAAWLAWRGIRPETKPAPAVTPQATLAERPAPASGGVPGSRAEIPAADGARRIVADWNLLLRLASAGTGPDELRQRLEETRRNWLQMDPGTVARTIGNLLRGGEDRPLGMPFEVGNHGFLAGWPSLRVFLLDVLAGSDPDAAAAIARDVLGGTNSADEYVTALRSLTRDGTGRAGDVELHARFDHMLARREWQDSRAFAEGFDLARLLASESVVTRLCGWNGNLRLRAAALHELAAEHPAVIVSARTALAQLDAADRANLMARADPADETQAAAVDRYLRDPALDPTEAAAFLRTFPLRSATTGYRLYGTSPRPYQRDEVLAGDFAALSMVENWLADPTLATLHPELEDLRERIGEWLPESE